MAESTGKILEGVFAIYKPPSLSSAQVIRDLQIHFQDSRLFAPLVQQTLARNDAERRDLKRRRTSSSRKPIKMGHGGTLDPMATGVLIIGVGAGTKRLPEFLLCPKTYDTTVLFGKSSDTYDIAGKNVAEAPYGHITRALVEEQLGQFRGRIRQVPPIYSALKIDGMKAYEYARSGRELPRELESREMEVTECELLEFHEGGTHDFRWPADEAGDEEKVVARKFMGEPEPDFEPPAANEDGKDTAASNADITSAGKAQDAANPEHPALPTACPPSPRSPNPQTTFHDSNNNTNTNKGNTNHLSPSAKASLHTHPTPLLSSTPCPAPLARVRLTVSSGFYVRSFAHDLGRALGSMGMMASLVRCRQGDFVCNSNEDEDEKPKEEDKDKQDATTKATTQALTYEELSRGEDVWGPRVEEMLREWAEREPLTGLEEQQRERVRRKEREGEGERARGFTPARNGDRSHDLGWDGGQQWRRRRGGGRRNESEPRGERNVERKRRRNSSSPE